jgi:glutaryl-CoA dehydrogenase
MTTTLTQAGSSDYYLLDELLTDEARAVRDRVRGFVDAEVLPIINDYWDRAEFPFELVPKIAQLGIIGTTIDGYGCPGLSRLAAGMVTREMSRGDGSVNTFIGVQSGLAMGSIGLLGSEEQKRRWLPGMATLHKIGAFALTEPNHGSDAVRLETTARRDGNQWVLNGAKRWIGNAGIADVIVVWARDVEDGRVKAIVMEKNPDGTYPDGYTTELITGKIGKRAVWQPDVLLRDVRGRWTTSWPAPNRSATPPGCSPPPAAARRGNRSATPWPPTTSPSPTRRSGSSSAGRSRASSSCSTSWPTCSPRSPRCSSTASGWPNCRSETG